MSEKILLFQPYYDLKGHFKSFLTTHEDVLSSNGFECYHVLGKESKKNISNFITEYKYNDFYKILRLLSTYIGLRKVKKVSKDQHISIIHFLDFEIVILCLFLILNKRFFLKKKLVLTLHSINYLQTEQGGFFRPLYKKTIVSSYRYIDSKFNVAIVTNGETLTDSFISEVGFKKNDIITSFWGTEKATPTLNLKEKEENSFLFLGIIRKDKNLEYLLDEFAKVENNYTLTIAGMPFGYENSELTALIENCGISKSRIETHLNFLDKQDYESLLANHQYLVLPYKEENKSNSGPLIQALQYNVVPIVSDYGERAQIVKKNNVGYTFKFEEGPSLSDIIKKIINDNAAPKNIYLKNIEEQKNSFLWKNIIEKLIYEHKVYTIRSPL